MPVRNIVTGVLAAAVAFLAATADARLTVMHGFPDLTSVTLWVQVDRAGPVEIELAPAAGGEPWRVSLAAEAASDFVATARIPGLAPGSAYRYRVSAQGESRDGVIATQPYWARGADAAELSFAIGSCAFLPPENPAWPGRDYGGDFRIFDAIAAKKPDLMLWLGDNLYLQPPDFLDPASAAAHYRQVRQADPLQKL